MSTIKITVNGETVEMPTDEARRVWLELSAIFASVTARKETEKVTFVPVFIPPVTPYVVTSPAFPRHDPFEPWYQTVCKAT